jgi:magnesium-transporting ATPase (P-type)
MNVSEFVDPQLINTDLKANSRDGVLKEMAWLLHIRYPELNPQQISQKLISRENAGTTALPNGTALPHIRVSGLERPVILVGISKRGVIFGGSEPVKLFLLFLTPDDDTALHLKLLSMISSLLQNNKLIDMIKETHTREAVYRTFKMYRGKREYYVSLSSKEILVELDCKAEGLSSREAEKRLEEFGPNLLKAAVKENKIKKFSGNLVNALALIMWFGAALAFLIDLTIVGWSIIAVIFLNASFSFWQEYKAERALEALRAVIPRKVSCLRDGIEQEIDASQIVPGDIVFLEEGNSVSADARLLESAGLRVDNSVFSGESRPGYKSAQQLKSTHEYLWTELPNMVFAGTSVVSGNGKAVVTATGMSTEIGRVAFLAQTVKEELSPLQKEIVNLARLISLVAAFMGVGLVLMGSLFAGLPFAAAAVFGLGIIVANVPEGLLPIVTLALATAVQRMAGRNVIVKKLSSVETLGSTDVICTDKTGTLTMNQVFVKKVWVNGNDFSVEGNGYEPSGEFMIDGMTIGKNRFSSIVGTKILLEISTYCNTATLVAPDKNQPLWSVKGDPTEGALLSLAAKAGLDTEKLRADAVYKTSFPFESARKRMSVVKVTKNGLRVLVKGAPTELISSCTHIVISDKMVDLTSKERGMIVEKVNSFGVQGLRVLGFAFKDVPDNPGEYSEVSKVESGLCFIGLTAMYDPPRPEIAEAVKKCRSAGIRLIMLTGDYELTAETISRQIGLIDSHETGVISGSQLDSMNEHQLRNIVQKVSVFARVTPEHKFRIVDTLKSAGHIVAVTGDGVNDSPALKRADIGIAMGLRGTDVARESADLILTDDNFASIVAGIEEGRTVFENIRRFLIYIFAHLTPEVIPFSLYALFGIPVPLTALQILAIDLGTETLPALALGTEKPDPGIMKRPPRRPTEGLVNIHVITRGYLYLGLLSTIVVLGGYFGILLRGGWSWGEILEPDPMIFQNPLHMKAMTMAFAAIAVMQIANAFACRTEIKSAVSIGLTSNRLLISGIIFELVFIIMLINIPLLSNIFNLVPLGITEWTYLIFSMLAIFAIEEARKMYRRKRYTV